MDVAIFGNGHLENLKFVNKIVNLDNMFIIGVDGGCNYLIKNHIKINLAIGDFDSIEDKNLLKDTPTITKTNMDYSDLELAAEYCFKNKFKKVYLFGFTGKRSDHFLFNIRVMQKMFDFGIEVYMIDEFNIITLINKEKEFEKSHFKFFSILPIFEETIISISGSKYDLNKEKLSMVSTLTLSNEWKEEKVKIIVNKLVLVHLIF